MLKKLTLATLLAGTAVLATPAMAAIVMTTGAGSAVSIVQATATFDPRTSLTDNPYLEGGLSFSRTNLTFDNNGCGYAGCPGHVGFTGFTGNYMYGTGTGGYFDLQTTGTTTFSGLEFVLGTGFFTSTADVSWQAYLGGNLVGSGSASGLAVGTVLGFSGGLFDTLRYSDGLSFSAPAFDTVAAQFGTSAVPEPATWGMMIAGFGLLGATLRRRQKLTSVSFG